MEKEVMRALLGLCPPGRIQAADGGRGPKFKAVVAELNKYGYYRVEFLNHRLSRALRGIVTVIDRTEAQGLKVGQEVEVTGVASVRGKVAFLRVGGPGHGDGGQKRS
ncbi:MAG: hypothetical protein QXT45_05000 [Candidatus Bilamarchaeaceae archaeon]